MRPRRTCEEMRRFDPSVGSSLGNRDQSEVYRALRISTVITPEMDGRDQLSKASLKFDLRHMR